MKYDTSGISLTALAAHLEKTYGFPFAALCFTPKGEEAFSYVASGPGGEQFFVRVQPNAQNNDLESVYAAVAAMREDERLPALLAPYRSAAGRFTSRFGPFAVVLFPFIAGMTAYETNVSEGHWLQMAEIISALHASHVPLASRETFGNPFVTAIQEALRRATSSDPSSSTYQRRTIALLREHQADVQNTLRRMRDLGAAARRLPLAVVPTHGDPNLANFLIAEDASLHLTDWGELAMGLRERDLSAFTGECFAQFLRRYLECSEGRRLKLHRAFFAFYAYRWVEQEIADYTSRILNGRGDPDEEAHAWEELQPYLPAQHAEIEDGLNAITKVLTQLAAEGLLDVEDASP